MVPHSSSADSSLANLASGITLSRESEGTLKDALGRIASGHWFLHQNTNSSSFVVKTVYMWLRKLAHVYSDFDHHLAGFLHWTEGMVDFMSVKVAGRLEGVV